MLKDIAMGEMSLQALADRQESGIILYEASKEAIVLNWSTYGSRELPKMLFGNPFPMESPEPWQLISEYHTADARVQLEGADSLYDANGDLAGDDPIPATVYELNSSEPTDGPDIRYSSVTVIVPDGWN